MTVIELKNEHAQEVKNSIEQNDGYCCCKMEKTPDTKCMCKEFKDQISDPNFEGKCFCGRYEKKL